jgi:methylmalonyl-CoA mutase cobalamin-binding domain/chain
VQAGRSRTSDSAARALAESLTKAGIHTAYLGAERTAAEIASTAQQQDVDAVELCLAGTGGVLIIRELLQALREIGRRDVSIVVHRVD